MSRTRALVGMAGGPTVVVDPSLHACCEVLAGRCDVLGVVGGPHGLVAGAFVPIQGLGLLPSPRAGSALGSGRRNLTEHDLSTIVTNLNAAGIGAVVLAGGNGTMALLGAIETAARIQGLSLQVVGIPKTIDNDLLGVDFSPGFGSAARNLAMTVPDIARDHRSMASIEPIRVIETMGRGVGWLAAAASVSVLRRGDNVDLCLVPEFPSLDEDAICAAVDDALRTRSRAFVVCSEGYPFKGHGSAYRASTHPGPLFGGVARRLARFLGANLGAAARGEVLGTQQRSSTAFVSAMDLKVAREAGQAAGLQVLEECGGVMVGTQRLRDDPYQFEVCLVPLAEVAGATRRLSESLVPVGSGGLEEFGQWLAPLIPPAAGTSQSW